MRFLQILIPLFLFALNLSPTTFAKTGYEIKVKIDKFDQEEIFLGHYLMDKQYINDTATLEKNGYFVFSGEESLPGGVYIIVLPPDNKFFQILINPDEQHFTVETSLDDLVKELKVEGSEDNVLFYDYLRFLNEKRPASEKIKKQISEAGDNKKDKEKLNKELEEVNQRVTDYQQNIVKKHPQSLSSMIIKSTQEIPVPEFEGSKEEAQKKRWLYYRDHYFDFIDLEDPRILRTPVLFNRVNYYVEKLTVQHPDSINMAIDRILKAMEPNEETFKYYLVHFLNEYAGSKIVGMDGVYVHLVEEYYMTGKATWTEEEQLQKIIDNAKTLKPILIGKITPDLNMQLLDIEGTLQAKDNESEFKRFETKGFVPLHEVRSPYTVLVFWAPDCGHCKKAMPKLREFYEKYKDKGVEVYAVCSKTYKDMPSCAQFIKDKKLTGWINAVDPFFKTKFKTIYDIRTTPQVYVLDDKKEILIKRIGIEQLEDVMNDIMNLKEKEEGSEKSKP